MRQIRFRFRIVFCNEICEAENERKGAQAPVDAQRTLLQNVNGLLQGSRKHLEIHTQRFQGQLSKLEAAFESRMSIPSAHLGKSIVCLHERTRALIELAGQELESAWRRTEEGAARNLQQAQTRCQQNLNGLVEGARKHLDVHEERFHRRLAMFRALLDRTFDARHGQIATRVVQLQEKTRASFGLRERDLNHRQAKLVLGFDRLVDRRRDTLALKTSRFTLAQYERIVDPIINTLEERKKRLDALSPERLLARGYSITRDEGGRILYSVSDVKTGQTLYTQLARGKMASVVTRKENTEDVRDH